MFRALRVVVTFALVLLVCSASFAVPHYTLVNLGSIGGPEGWAVDVNSRGEVVGQAQIRSGEYHAFLWRSGKMIDLGVLPGYPQSIASGINNRGEIVGQCSGDETGYRDNMCAFIWKNGQMSAVGGRQQPSSAYDINELGQIVGQRWTQPNLLPGFVYSLSRMTALPTLPGGLEACGMGINDSGAVAGYSTATGWWENHAVVWQNGRITNLAADAVANDINNNGVVVGQYRGRAAMWVNGKTIDLGCPEGYSQAYGINNSGTVVGLYEDPFDPYAEHAFIWEKGRLYSLTNLIVGPRPQWLSAYAISDTGYIAGLVVANAVMRPVLLRPVGAGQ
jgi:probable HAF family extracellular repeat protein